VFCSIKFYVVQDNFESRMKNLHVIYAKEIREQVGGILKCGLILYLLFLIFPF
jgi:hypothetical protein